MKRTIAGLRLAALSVFACATSAAHADIFNLRWSEPTQNTDNTPLTNVSGYFIYWGESPESMFRVWYVETAGMSIPLPRMTTNQYVAVTTLNTDGVESAKSAILLISPE